MKLLPKLFLAVLLLAIFIFAVYIAVDEENRMSLGPEKVNASKENHNRVRDFIAARFTQCVAGSQYITLKNSATETSNYNCTMNTDELTQPMIVHFRWEGLKNPHNLGEKPVWRHSSTNPPLGRTYIYPVGNTLRIITNVGTRWGRNKILTTTVTKE